MNRSAESQNFYEKRERFEDDFGGYFAEDIKKLINDEAPEDLAIFLQMDPCELQQV